MGLTNVKSPATRITFGLRRLFDFGIPPTSEINQKYVALVIVCGSNTRGLKPVDKFPIDKLPITGVSTYGSRMNHQLI